MGTENNKKLKCRRKNIWRKIRSIARTVSIDAVLQLRFHYAVNYFSFDAGVLFAFFVFGDTFSAPEGWAHYLVPRQQRD